MKQQSDARIRLTMRHPEFDGIPVFVEKDGRLATYKSGLMWARHVLGWDYQDMADFWGISTRTLERYFQGATPPCRHLNSLLIELEDRGFG